MNMILIIINKNDNMYKYKILMVNNKNFNNIIRIIISLYSNEKLMEPY